MILDEELVQGDDLVVDRVSQGREAVGAFPIFSVEEVENLAVPGESRHDVGKAGFPGSDLLCMVDNDLDC
jgi:hypothetical protein